MATVQDRIAAARERRAALRQKMQTEPAVEEEEVEEEEEEAPRAPRKPTTATKKKVVIKKKAVKEPDTSEEEEEEEAPVKKKAFSPPEKVSSAAVFEWMTGVINEGRSLILRPIGRDNAFEVVDASVLALPARQRGVNARTAAKDFYSQDYVDWLEEWNTKTYEEKKAYAKKNKIKWDEHPNTNIDHMRITEAVRQVEVPSKYKPEYQSREARAAARKRMI